MCVQHYTNQDNCEVFKLKRTAIDTVLQNYKNALFLQCRKGGKYWEKGNQKGQLPNPSSFQELSAWQFKKMLSAYQELICF